PRPLDRECFVRCVRMCYQDLRLEAFGSVQDWLALGEARPMPQVILFNIGTSAMEEDDIRTEIEQILKLAPPIPLVLLGESDDLSEMIEAMESGADGYIPACVGIDDIVEAMRLAAMGGMFLPKTSVSSLRRKYAVRQSDGCGIEDHLTERQLAVANAMRRGLANKIIAHELNLCESTVKVHIRNIMKKLKATNRTEAAFKLNTMRLDHNGPFHG
ncbi:response regulator transcription factor, partial [Thioclava sp. BHET1]